MSDQLSELIQALRIAKDEEAAAALDLKDREEDVREAERKRKRAEAWLSTYSAHTKRAWDNLHALIDARTHSAFEDEAEEWR